MKPKKIQIQCKELNSLEHLYSWHGSGFYFTTVVTKLWGGLFKICVAWVWVIMTQYACTAQSKKILYYLPFWCLASGTLLYWSNPIQLRNAFVASSMIQKLSSLYPKSYRIRYVSIWCTLCNLKYIILLHKNEDYKRPQIWFNGTLPNNSRNLTNKGKQVFCERNNSGQSRNLSSSILRDGSESLFPIFEILVKKDFVIVLHTCRCVN